MLPSIIVPAVILVVLIIAWAVDTSSGEVARNVAIGGRAVGGSSESELAAEVRDAASDFADTAIEIHTEDRSYETTAGAIGLMVDEDRTAANAKDIDSDTFVLFRPFAWLASLVADRDAAVAYQVNGDKVTSTVLALEGDDRVPPTEPTVELVDGVFKVVPGKEGSGIDPADVAKALPRAAKATSLGEPIRIEVDTVALPPLGTPAEAEEAAAGAEALVNEPITLTTSAGNREISSDTLRTWVTLSTNPDGSVVVDLDPGRVDPALKGAFANIAGGPKDATFTIQDGKPVVVPEQPGRVCCGEGSAAKIMESLRAGTRTIALDLVDGGAPSFTAAQAAELGIVEEIGSPTVFGPTTEHKCCESRVTNIHRIADLVRGVVIKPGDTFSVNDHVGRRTRANGFTDGGAISGGVFVTGIGGGISQFATTLFNAALYAGLDFGEYQSHSIYISRYPKGHEATLSYPHPDLQIKNTTPYGVLIWPTYTDTSITVHLYSTKHFSSVTVGEPTPSAAGNCTRWTTPRHRVYPDGRTKDDTVFARYRPAEGVNC
ncbi:MAG: VanW family protein [Actinomycetota bacterium]|nr:VanW family protein [Actinomycetota bacterium]